MESIVWSIQRLLLYLSAKTHISNWTTLIHYYYPWLKLNKPWLIFVILGLSLLTSYFVTYIIPEGYSIVSLWIFFRGNNFGFWYQCSKARVAESVGFSFVLIGLNYLSRKFLTIPILLVFIQTMMAEMSNWEKPYNYLLVCCVLHHYKQ